ncbi:head GIN domain-containing protein [Lutibacter sp. Hel_I_33_5]|uniref:head GIN domain-containing protein n=1 Tax=Lutibacter sp. Hel_I_33_5 TaxID=1566289 RepID=UPI0016495AA5|nr:head GIN domain-containing protein [Lutibacter sp. Hel_I_33_5]
MKKLIITSLLLTLCFNVTAQSWWNSEKVRGNGNVVTKNRTTSDYEGVSVGGSFDVILVKGKEGKITIKGEENIIPYIITEVRNGTLKIKYEKNVNVRTTRKLTVTVPYKDIDKVSLGGSGNISNEGVIKGEDVSFSLGGSGDIRVNVDANHVKSSIGGSGNIKLSGKTDSFKCSIAGSGSIKAYELDANSLKASIAGSGSIRTSVKNKIKASVVGSGSIYYKGNPKIDSKSVGSGDVISRN